MLGILNLNVEAVSNAPVVTQTGCHPPHAAAEVAAGLHPRSGAPRTRRPRRTPQSCHRPLVTTSAPPRHPHPPQPARHRLQAPPRRRWPPSTRLLALTRRLGWQQARAEGQPLARQAMATQQPCGVAPVRLAAVVAAAAAEAALPTGAETPAAAAAVAVPRRRRQRRRHPQCRRRAAPWECPSTPAAPAQTGAPPELRWRRAVAPGAGPVQGACSGSSPPRNQRLSPLWTAALRQPPGAG
jgi:hypothetical protein